MPGLARIVYVSNGRGDTVTPIATATNTPGPPISVSPAPGEIVVTPDGKTAYVTTDGPLVVPIATATSTVGPPIRVGVHRPGLHDKPVALAITPDGKTAYAANIGSGTVTPIDTARNTSGEPIEVGVRPPGDRDHAGWQDRLRGQSEQAAAPALAQLRSGKTRPAATAA